MNYWKGMNWLLATDWKCEVCGNKPITISRNKEGTLGFAIARGLAWGIVHAMCRCWQCHAKYMMRDSDGNQVARPISQLKPEYKDAARVGWQRRKKPISEWSKAMWDKAQEWAEKEASDGP